MLVPQFQIKSPQDLSYKDFRLHDTGMFSWAASRTQGERMEGRLVIGRELRIVVCMILW
jgi:hypothetical protein